MLKKEVVVDVLVLKRQGLSLREIARRLGIHRKTVKKYLEHPELIGRYVMKKPAEASSWDLWEPLN
jgi:transposase